MKLKFVNFFLYLIKGGYYQRKIKENLSQPNFRFVYNFRELQFVPNNMIEQNNIVVVRRINLRSRRTPSTTDGRIH